MDLLVFAPHPDDAEISAGGLLLKTAGRGGTTAVVDLTRGEAGTRGTVEIRREEAEAATKALRLKTRENLGLPDAHVEVTPAAKRAVTEVIRRLKPVLVALPWTEDPHPDHAATGRLVEDAAYLAGLARYEPDCGPAHKPRALLHYIGRLPLAPSFVVDIGEHYEAKLAAVRCHRSQFHDPGSRAPQTRLSGPDFWARYEARHRHYGSLIGVEFGEPYVVKGPLPVGDPFALWGAHP